MAWWLQLESRDKAPAILAKSYIKERLTLCEMNSPVSSIPLSDRLNRAKRKIPSLEACSKLKSFTIDELKIIDRAVQLKDKEKLPEKMKNCATSLMAQEQITSGNAADRSKHEEGAKLGTQIAHLANALKEREELKVELDKILLNPHAKQYDPSYLDTAEFKNMKASCEVLMEGPKNTFTPTLSEALSCMSWHLKLSESDETPSLLVDSFIGRRIAMCVVDTPVEKLSASEQKKQALATKPNVASCWKVSPALNPLHLRAVELAMKIKGKYSVSTKLRQCATALKVLEQVGERKHLKPSGFNDISKMAGALFEVVLALKETSKNVEEYKSIFMNSPKEVYEDSYLSSEEFKKKFAGCSAFFDSH